MTFSSPVFLFLFFPLTVCVYFLIPAKFLHGRNAFLTAASLIFYAFGEPAAMLLMLLVVAWSWGSALLMAKCPKQKRLFQVLGVLGDLAVLILYKYADFLITSANDLFGLSLPLMRLRLPIGISFFVFQAVSYVMDTARGEAEPQKSYFRLLLYIAFFPQLIAGPIVRYQTVAEALSDRRTTPEMLAKGVRRMIFGLSKKLLIADTLGQIADTVYGTEAVMLPAAWLGAICYAFQIFYDFSGYSDMAIGMGQIFGFSFPENFRYPYCAGSLTDFWRRWHISLTTWFRQYLYIPLGGNRRGNLRTVLNKWTVFLCTGLWHGASWNFVIWGIIHGFFMTLEQLFSGGKKAGRKKRKKSGTKWYLRIYTLLVVVLAFVVFRAEDLPAALRMYRAMFTPFRLNDAAVSATVGMLSPLVLTVLGAAVLFATPLPEKTVRCGEKHAADVTGFVLGGVSLALLVLCMMNAAATVYHPFIYFRF
ncbi:MAG: MBOAT family protein [Oscillospiraceae bacterium]|nr:MBOAT family protein [Oscillospiraceae bacterium]